MIYTGTFFVGNKNEIDRICNIMILKGYSMDHTSRRLYDIAIGHSRLSVFINRVNGKIDFASYEALQEMSIEHYHYKKFKIIELDNIANKIKKIMRQGS